MHFTLIALRRAWFARAGLGAFACGALVAGALSGCSSSQSSSTGTAANPEQLTMAIAWTGTQAAGIPPLLKIYNQEHPNVHWNLVENVNEQKLLAEEAAGDAPSVAMLDTTDLVASMATSGAILPLQSYISSSKLDVNEFTPASLYSNSYLGAQYALPFFEDTYALYYNKTLFAKAGIAQPPTTLSELAADAGKLSITGPDGQYTQLGFEPTMPKQLEGYMFGGNWADASGQVTATNPLTVKGAQWIVDTEKQLDPSKVQRFMAGSSGAVSTLDPFASGKVAMDVSGEWFMPTILQQSPNMDFGVAPIPYPDGEPQYSGTGSVGGNPLVVLKGTQDADAAWNLIDWLATTGQEIATKTPPVYHDIYSVPALKSLVSNAQLAPTPQMAFFWQYSGGKNIHPFPPVPGATTYLNAITSAVQQAQLTPTSVSSALQQVQSQYGPLVAGQIKSAQAQAH
ncbi:ABC transporter substrate-binding protein [Pseudonocardia yunnanensis]|uniref:Extracellular solute-binding protein n=1 Tax=Pseudonocardia yunnanensis TaxID=58107 RepID=A0ABW4EPT0_9PSEU